ncbi:MULTISPECIES: TetR/AcrR family transcriptional regulator [Nocardia]|uniref:TetR/AcrR family transcriptional regulator n=1 Tax=Nocardia TaxID=1817 RepID=UPI0002E32880|nr:MULTISPECIES: TetR/AcrR family transcriptional regulator [Nocardia]
MTTADARPRRRADAQRSIAAIVAAARAQLSADPEAGVEDIARAAGVGRQTLYGHFRTRADLVDAALTDALAEGEKALAVLDLDGDADHALTTLLTSSWALVAESAALLTAVQATLGPDRVRDLHAVPAQRLTALLDRGRAQGVVRTDLPVEWLVNLVHYVLHGAATELRAGRLTADQVPGVVTATIRSALRPDHTRP